MILILPDIHGRTFWEEPVKDIDKFERVVFLGDYLDPYGVENITPEDAIVNFEKILEFANNNKDKVTMLIGNHDMPYFVPKMTKCRHDNSHHNDIENMFMDNFNLFSIAYEKEIDGSRFLFSHAGFLKIWLKETDMWTTSFVDELNGILKDKEDSKLRNLFDYVSYYRGGYDRFGSCVWADVMEHTEASHFGDSIQNVYQIFGHTQLIDKPIITEKFADLDCRRAFILTDEGEIKEYGRE